MNSMRTRRNLEGFPVSERSANNSYRYACHCDTCRRTTGNVYYIDASWPAPRSSVDISALKVYHFGPSCDLSFCGTCSTPLFTSNPKDPDQSLGVFTGTLDNIPEDLIKIVEHIFVGDTKDGGASMWMRSVNADGEEAKRFTERSQDGTVDPLPIGWPANETMTGFETWKDDTVRILCKCEGVDLLWHKGNYEGKKKEELPWFIDPTTHKSLAGFCSCDSCRLFSGVDLCNWTYGELKYISFPTSGTPNDKPFPSNTSDLKALVDVKDPSIGTLAYYASSPDVQRYFCGSCSASIFYAVDDRLEIVDVAIGVLRASDGARAEGFLSWALGVIGHIVDSKGGWRYGLLERVTKEMEEWRIERGYPKCWRRVEREEAAKKV